MENKKIAWTASNNNSFLRGYRVANCMRTAVRDAHAYVDGELSGNGSVSYYPADKTGAYPIRRDEATRWAWTTE